jgi:hypothetical protein
MIPNPPVCISTSRINCPNRENSFPVFKTVRPVTQVADVDEKRASTNDRDPECTVAWGSIKRADPRRIVIAKLSSTIRGGELNKNTRRVSNPLKFIPLANPNYADFNVISVPVYSKKQWIIIWNIIKNNNEFTCFGIVFQIAVFCRHINSIYEYLHGNRQVNYMPRYQW